MTKSEFNIVAFLAIFLFFLQGFYFYIGLTTPGGRLYVPFLADHFNFPYWLTVLVTKISKWLLEIGGYTVHQANPANITIAGSRGVTVAWGCLGVGAMSLWLAFIAAHRYLMARSKLKWLAAGFILISFINMLRIVMIALSNHHHWKYIHSFNAHTSFNVLTYAVIIIMMAFFVRHYNKNKQRTYGNRQIVSKDAPPKI